MFCLLVQCCPVSLTKSHDLCKADMMVVTLLKTCKIYKEYRKGDLQETSHYSSMRQVGATAKSHVLSCLPVGVKIELALETIHP